MKKDETNKISRWINVILILFLLGIMSFFFSIIIGFFISEEPIANGNVAIIPVNGVIEPKSMQSTFSTGGAYPEDIVGFIKKAQDNPEIKAVVFDINSPGGYPVASHEIVKAIKQLNKTKIAVIRDVGASGAYWVASATDKIYCDEMSLTGSIGVNSAFITIEGLLKDYNITYQRIVGGKYKDTGSIFKDLNDDERQMLQDITDSAHEYFVNDVAQNRNIPLIKMNALAQGQVFLGIDAYQKGLVDKLGGMDEALTDLEKEINTSVKVVRYEKKETILDLFSSVSTENSYSIGRGIGEELSNPKLEQKPIIIT